MRVIVKWEKKHHMSGQPWMPIFDYPEGVNAELEKQRIRAVQRIIRNIPQLGTDDSMIKTDQQIFWFIDILLKEGEVDKEGNKITNYKALLKKAQKYRGILMQLVNDGKTVMPLQWQILKRGIIKSDHYTYDFTSSDVAKEMFKKKIKPKLNKKNYKFDGKVLTVKKIEYAVQINDLFWEASSLKDEKTSDAGEGVPILCVQPAKPIKLDPPVSPRSSISRNHSSLRQAFSGLLGVSQKPIPEEDREDSRVSEGSEADELKEGEEEYDETNPGDPASKIMPSPGSRKSSSAFLSESMSFLKVDESKSYDALKGYDGAKLHMRDGFEHGKLPEKPGSRPTSPSHRPK